MAGTSSQAPWRQAEHTVAQWMRSWGLKDVQVTQSTNDGGVDVRSREAVAQVKQQAKPVGRPPVQQLKGAAHRHQNALFFSWSGYSSGAVTWADEAGVALFSTTGAGPVAVNRHAASFLAAVDAASAATRRARLQEEREKAAADKKATKAARARKRADAKAAANTRRATERAERAALKKQIEEQRQRRAAAERDQAQRMQHVRNGGATPPPPSAAVRSADSRSSVADWWREHRRKVVAAYGPAPRAERTSTLSIVVGTFGFACPIGVLSAIAWFLALDARRQVVRAGLARSPVRTRAAAVIASLGLCVSALILGAGIASAFYPTGSRGVGPTLAACAVFLAPVLLAVGCLVWWRSLRPKGR